jgi:hypothetical protein
MFIPSGVMTGMAARIIVATKTVEAGMGVEIVRTDPGIIATGKLESGTCQVLTVPPLGFFSFLKDARRGSPVSRAAVRPYVELNIRPS